MAQNSLKIMAQNSLKIMAQFLINQIKAQCCVDMNQVGMLFLPKCFCYIVMLCAFKMNN